MQQLPVLSVPASVPARQAQGKATDVQSPSVRQDVVDLRASRRLAREPEPGLQSRWGRSGQASERAFGGIAAQPRSAETFPRPTGTTRAVAAAFLAQLIGQGPAADTTAEDGSHVLAAAAAHSAYRQAGAEPALAHAAARRFDIAV